MKILLISVILIAVVIGLVAYAKKKGKKNYQDVEQEAMEEVWKDTKRTSERVNPTLSEEKRKASDKLNSLNNSGSSTFSNKSYGPRVDPLLSEGNQALLQMEKIEKNLKDEEIKPKISEIMSITKKIMQQAIDDPDDIPQIKKFFSYYLPTTVKLLHSYETMEMQEITGENIDKTKKNIREMLDVVIEAYKKRLDSLFENQALDIETEIDVMNQMLAREGLTENNDFVVKEGSQNG